MRNHGPREAQLPGTARGRAKGRSPRAIYLSLVVLLNALLFVAAPPRAQATGDLTVSSSALNFGNVVVGKSETISITLKNSGKSTLVLSGVSLTGAGFSSSGILYPKPLVAGAALPLFVKFAPTKAGSSSGTVQLFTTGANGTVRVSFKGTAVAMPASTPATTGDLTVSSSALSFGNVVVGKSETISITLKNSGKSTLVLSGVSLTGAGFSSSGILYPKPLVAGAALPLFVKFAPTKAGSSSGTVQLFTTGANGTVKVTLQGAGVASAATGYLTATPLTAQFQSVAVGTRNTQVIQLKNTGSASLTISGVTTTGSGFSVSGFTTPLSIAVGATSQLTVAFLPATAASVSGSVVLTSNASDSHATIVLSGTGVTTSRVLNVSPASIAFGNVSVNGLATQQLTLKNGGNSNISISGGTVNGSGLSVTGETSGTLSPGQTAVVTVDFSPKAAGSVTGGITILSNASNGASISVPVTGIGVVAAQAVKLQWQPSSSSGVIGYYVYRSTVNGGSYTKVAGSPVATTSYSDSNVSSGTEYYYVVTSVGSSGIESAYSSQVAVTVP